MARRASKLEVATAARMACVTSHQCTTCGGGRASCTECTADRLLQVQLDAACGTRPSPS